MKKTKNKWKTQRCGRCGYEHSGYTGKLDRNGIEYVVCGVTHKRMNVSGIGLEGNSTFFQTEWVKENNKKDVILEEGSFRGNMKYPICSDKPIVAPKGPIRSEK